MIKTVNKYKNNELNMTEKYNINHVLPLFKSVWNKFGVEVTIKCEDDGRVFWKSGCLLHKVIVWPSRSQTPPFPKIPHDKSKKEVDYINKVISKVQLNFT